MITLNTISKTFTNTGTLPIKVLENISLEIKNNEFISIVGPSGCGKSTLLKLISQLIQPSKGEIICYPSEKDNQRNIGFVFQNPVLLPWRNVLDNVELPNDIKGLPNISLARLLLEKVGLKEFENYLPEKLSGGMQQRVALARALNTQPSLLCLDEPFASVDDLTRLELNELVMQLYQEYSTTTILVTHNIEEAIFLSNRVLVLSDRPAKIIYNREISFQYPRSDELRKTIEFHELVTCIKQKLFDSKN